MALLAGLVWAMAPPRAKFVPAALHPVPATCPKDTPDFVPSDFTDIPGLDLASLSRDRRNHVLFRLNMEPCPCGCNQSVAACRLNHPMCPVCKGLAEKILAEEPKGPGVTPGK